MKPARSLASTSPSCESWICSEGGPLLVIRSPLRSKLKGKLPTMRYDVVTIVAAPRGASQLRELVSQLPAEFGIPVVCLAASDQRLVSDLAAATRLKVKWAEAGE